MGAGGGTQLVVRASVVPTAPPPVPRKGPARGKLPLGVLLR